MDSPRKRFQNTVFTSEAGIHVLKQRLRDKACRHLRLEAEKEAILNAALREVSEEGSPQTTEEGLRLLKEDRLCNCYCALVLVLHTVDWVRIKVQEELQLGWPPAAGGVISPHTRNIQLLVGGRLVSVVGFCHMLG